MAGVSAFVQFMQEHSHTQSRKYVHTKHAGENACLNRKPQDLKTTADRKPPCVADHSAEMPCLCEKTALCGVPGVQISSHGVNVRVGILL